MPLRISPTNVLQDREVEQIQEANPSVMTIHTAGSTFTPTLVLSDQSGVITWGLPDGTESHAATLNINWGTSTARVVTLLVEPWSALQRMNFGYAAADGGSPSIERVTQCDVTSILGLELVAPTLGQLCICNNANLHSLDLNDFVNLDTIECFGCTTLAHVSWRNMWKLARICFESCELEALDLSVCPAFADLRGGENTFNGINFGTSGEFAWHICVRTNDLHYSLPNMRQFPVLRELLCWDCNQHGVLDLNTGETSALYLVQASGNEYTSADFTDRFKGVNGPGIIELTNNNLTSMVLTGCTHIGAILAANNDLNEAAIDGILLNLASNALINGTVTLTGNAPPSLTGMGYVTTLRARGWTVNVDARVAVLASIAVTPAVTTVTEGLTRQMTATGTYDDASEANVTTTATWTSSAGSHATVGEHTGLVTGILVSTSNEVTITATIGAVHGDTTLTVEESSVTLESIAVTPAADDVTVGSTLQFTATGTYSDESTADITATVTWTSSDETHATIASGGLATGVAESTTNEVTITATLDTIHGDTTLSVLPRATVLTFTSEGAAVNMSCVVTGSPTITWNYSGGATASGANPAEYSWGTSAHRTSTVTISDPTTLTEFGIHGENVMGISSISGLDAYTNLTTICDVNDTSLTTIDVSGCHALTTLHLAGTGLTTEAADQLCIDLDAAVGSGSGQAIFIPNVVTSASAAARTSLAGKGWYVQLG